MFLVTLTEPVQPLAGIDSRRLIRLECPDFEVPRLDHRQDDTALCAHQAMKVFISFRNSWGPRPRCSAPAQTEITSSATARRASLRTYRPETVWHGCDAMCTWCSDQEPVIARMASWKLIPAICAKRSMALSGGGVRASAHSCL